MPTIERIFQKLSFVAIILFMFFMVYVFYLLLAPFHEPNIAQPFKVEPKVVKRGEAITVTVEVEKFADYQMEGTRTINCEDGNLVTLTSGSVSAPIGKSVIATRPVIVPEKTSLGMCKMVLVARYKVTPLKYEVITYESESFEVVE